MRTRSRTCVSNWHYDSLERRQLLAAVANGQEIIGTLEVGETETFEFQVTTPGQVQLMFGGRDAALLAPSADVFDESGNPVLTDRRGDSRRYEYLRFEATEGNYSIVVEDRLIDDATDYRFRAVQLSDNPALIPGEDGTMLNGVEHERSIAGSAMRLYTFDATTQGLVRFSTNSSTGFVFDDAGNFIENTIRFDGRGLKQDVDAQPGTYTLTVFNTDAIDSEFRTRATSVVQPFDEVAGRDATPANGEEVDIEIPHGTHAAISMQVDQPGTLLLSLAVRPLSKSREDVVLTDPSGQIIQPVVNPQDVADGFYQYEISALQVGQLKALISNGRENTTSIERSVRTLWLPASGAAPVTLIESRDDQVSVSETVMSSLPSLATFNIFPITITEFTTTRIFLETEVSGAIPMLRVYSPDGRLVSEDPGTGSFSSDQGLSPRNQAIALFEPTVTGTYYAVVQDRGLTGTVGVSMPFTLSTSSFPDSPILTNAEAVSLANGQEAVGSIPGGNGLFETLKFTVDSPGWVGATVSELVDSDGSDLALRIYQPDGTPVRSRSLNAGGTFYYKKTDSAVMLAFDAVQVGQYTLVVEQTNTDAGTDFTVRTFSSRDSISAASLVTGDIDLTVNGREYPVTIPAGQTILVQFDAASNVSSQLLMHGAQQDRVDLILSDSGELNSATVPLYLNIGRSEFTTIGSVAMSFSNSQATDVTVFVRRVSFDGTAHEHLSHEQQLINGRPTSLTVPIPSTAFYTLSIAAPGQTFVSLGAISNNRHRQLTIFDPSGNAVKSVPSSSRENGFSFSPSVAGVYTIALSPTSAAPVDYQLRVVSLLDDFELQPGQDGTLFPDLAINASTPDNGFSIFPFDTIAPGSVSLSVASGSRPRIEVFDETGAIVASVQDYGDVSVDFIAAGAGRYYAVVDNEVDPPVRPAFSFQIELNSSVVLPETHSTSGNGDQLEFSIATGESHVVAIDVAAAGPVLLTANTASYSDQDNLSVQVVGTDGQNIASFGSANGIAGEFLATASGTYYLLVSGNSQNGNQPVDVRLRTLAVAANVLDPPAVIAPQDGTFEENGDSVNATIPNGSFAVMQFYGVATEPIDVNVWFNNPGSDFFQFQIIDKAGSAHIDIIGQSSTDQTWTPSSDGTYFIVLHSVDAEIADFSVQIFGNVPFPPQIVSIQRNVDQPEWLFRPDHVSSLSFQFDKDVEVTNTELMVRNLQTDEVTHLYPSTESYDTETFTAVWTYSDQFDPLEPGNYELTIRADSILDKNGFRPLAEDVKTTIYLAIPGDINQDGRVDVLNDAFAFVANLGNNGESMWAYGDFNGDRRTDVLNDAFILIAHLGQDINPTDSSASLFGKAEPITLRAASSAPLGTLPPALSTQTTVSVDEEDFRSEPNRPLVSDTTVTPQLMGHITTVDIDSVFADRS